MLRLLLLLALPASTTACIPTKHPEPGIPATTTTTTPGPACTPFAALPLNTCEAALGYPPNTCTKAVQTGQSISCGGKKVLFIGSMYATNPSRLTHVVEATCDMTMAPPQWRFRTDLGSTFTQKQADTYLGKPVMIACEKT